MEKNLRPLGRKPLQWSWFLSKRSNAEPFTDPLWNKLSHGPCVPTGKVLRCWEHQLFLVSSYKLHYLKITWVPPNTDTHLSTETMCAQPRQEHHWVQVLPGPWRNSKLTVEVLCLQRGSLPSRTRFPLPGPAASQPSGWSIHSAHRSWGKNRKHKC